MASKSQFPKGTASNARIFSGASSKASLGFIRSLRSVLKGSLSSAMTESSPPTTCVSSKKPQGKRVSFEVTNHALFKKHYDHLQPLPSGYLLEEVAPGDKVRVHLANHDARGVRIASLRADLEPGLFLADIYRVGAPRPEHKAAVVSIANIIEIVDHASKNWSNEESERQDTKEIIAKLKAAPHDKLLAAQGLPPFPGSQRQTASGYAVVRDVPAGQDQAIFLLISITHRAGDAYWGGLIVCDGPGTNGIRCTPGQILTFCKKSAHSFHDTLEAAMNTLFQVANHG